MDNPNLIEEVWNSWHTIRKYFVCSIMEAASYENRKSFPIIQRNFNVETDTLNTERYVKNVIGSVMKEMWRYKFKDIPKYGLLVVECSLKNPQQANKNTIRSKIKKLMDRESFYSVYEDAILAMSGKEDRENVVPLIIYSIEKNERLCLNNTSIDKGWIIHNGKRIFLNEPHAYKVGGFDL